MTPHARRVDALRALITERGFDSLIVTGEMNIRYLTGLSGHDAALLVTTKRLFFITDSRYVQEARERLARWGTVCLSRGGVLRTAGDLIGTLHLRRPAFEGRHLSYSAALLLRRCAAGKRLRPATGLVESIRAVKDSTEIDRIRAATRLTKRILRSTATKVRAGITEEAIARQIISEYVRAGAASSFPSIVAAGPNSAKPHAEPGPARVRADSFVMIDTGCALNGYCADMTRMIVVGAAQARFRKLYAIVRTAQEYALETIRPGVRIAEVDEAARGIIRAAGFGARFTHALGHGVGMAVHEEPRIAPGSSERLQPGMIFTVEPAIYIPGYGGVRIEDMVLVTKNGFELLTR